MIRLKEVLEVFKISKPTIYRWIDSGCPVHYAGSIPYFDIEEVNEWIKKEKKGE
jgi:predicted DNA-binding transcriptional regulator AlpA